MNTEKTTEQKKDELIKIIKELDGAIIDYLYVFIKGKINAKDR